MADVDWSQFRPADDDDVVDWSKFKPAPEKSGTLRRVAQDAAVGLAKGAVAVPQAVVGLADIATGGRVGKFLENEDGLIGFRPKAAQDELETWYTPETQAARKKVQEAEGFVGTAKTMLENPSSILTGGVESLPSMAAGGLIGRGVMAAVPRVAPIGAAAVGEGAVMAGQAAANIREQTADGLLTPGQAALAGATGVAGAAIARVGGAAANKLGIGDLDTAIVQGGGKEAAKRGIISRTLLGGAVEGGVEEMPQSMTEQALQNVALDRPVGERVAEAGAQGLITGAPFGMVGANIPAAAATRQGATTETPGKEPTLDEQIAELEQSVDGFLASTTPTAQVIDSVTQAGSVDEAIEAATAAAGTITDLGKEAAQKLQALQTPAGTPDLQPGETRLLSRGADVALPDNVDLPPSMRAAAAPARQGRQEPPALRADVSRPPNPSVVDMVMSEMGESLPRFRYSPQLQGNKQPTPQTEPDLVAAYVAQMRETDTPAARAFVHLFDTGRMTTADVAEVIARQNPELRAPAPLEIPSNATPPAQDGLQVAPAPNRVPEGRNAARGRPLTDQDLTPEGAAARLAGVSRPAAGPIEGTTPTGIVLPRETEQRAAFLGRNTAIRQGNQALDAALAERGGERRTAPRPTRVAGQDPTTLSDEQLQAIAQDERVPAVSRRGAETELAARRLEQRASQQDRTPSGTTEGGIIIPSQQRDPVSEKRKPEGEQAAEQQDPGNSETTPKYTHEESVEVDPASLPAQARAQESQLSRENHRFLKALARLFGQKLVVFQSAREDAPDGYVRKGDARTIYINVRSEQAHLVVFGHELLHQIKATSPKAYEAIRSVIKLRAGANLNVPGINGDMEEVTADLVGNLFADTTFWREVFGQLTRPEAVRLGDVISRVVDRFKRALGGMQGFDTGSLVENLDQVRVAAAGALAQYAREQAVSPRSDKGSVSPQGGTVDTSEERVQKSDENVQVRSPAAAREEKQRAAGEAARRSMGDRFSAKRETDDRQPAAAPGGQQSRVVSPAGDAPRYGTAQEDSLPAVSAWHFSQQSRPVLSSAAYGQGLKGDGRERFLNAADPRSRQRIYFYVDKGKGIHPESGVGGAAHEVVLENLYDADADPRRLKRGNDWQAFESGVLDAGFDGYLYREHNLSAAAVLLGPRTVRVAYRGVGREATKPGAGVRVQDSKAVAWETNASGPAGAMEAKAARMRENKSWSDYDIRVTPAVNGFARVETRKKLPVLNVGLSTAEVAGGGQITEDDVRQALQRAGVTVADLEIQQSDTEQTAVVTVSRELTPEEGDQLSRELQQEAIAMRRPDGTGELFGPQAANWGPFNPEFFVLPGGERAAGPAQPEVTEVAFDDFAALQDNASGESAASLEAQSRVRQERELGRPRVLWDRAGGVRPIFGVDGVDQRARTGQVLLQRGVGAAEWTVLDRGPGTTAADVARATAAANEVRASAKRQDLFPDEFATKRTTVETDIVISSNGDRARGGNVNSEGQQIAQTKQALKNFWSWFGASEATDDRGRPLLMYHSTNGDIARFEVGRKSTNNYGLLGDVEVSRSGIFMTPSKFFSQEYLREGSGQNVMPVYASIKNPLDLRSGLSFQDERVLEEAGVNARYVINAQNYWELFDNSDDGSNDFVAGLRAAGYDGAIFREASPGGESDGGVTYVAFDPAQVKSAMGNRGTFDARDPDIRFSSKRVVLKPEIIQTVGRHIRNLSPDEQAKLRRNTAERFVEIIEMLPKAAEMAAVAFAGRAKRGWYMHSAKAIEHVFGADGPRFAALLAAMSPQTSVEANLYNALATWKNWVQAGRPTTREEIIEVMGRSVQGNKGVDSVLDAWINNSVRALSSQDPSSLVISGPKVNSFMLNLRGYVDEVTNDAWMAAYAKIDQVLFSGGINKAGTEPGKGPGYLAMSARVRETAKMLTKLTGTTWTPAEVQETVWSWAKTLYESASVNRSARDIISDQGLTEAMIQSTPDFRTLFHDDVNEDLLRAAGLGDQVSSLRARGDLAASVGEIAGAEGQAAPFDRGTQEKYELRAAGRLDKLRAERAAAAAAGDEVKASAKRQTETPEFKRWFGDSKVVDEQGEPLVVYHGTARSDPAFRPDRGGGIGGIYFAPSAAEASEHARMDSEVDGGAPLVIPAYLSIKSPKVFVDSIDSQEFTVAQMREWEQQGFDGVIGKTSSGQIVEIAAFRPEQIKSAIGNDGSFDATDPDIRSSAKRNNFGQTIDSTWSMRPGEKVLGVDKDQFLYKAQDKFIDLKRLTEAVQGERGRLGDELKVHDKETLFHGRAAKRTKDFLDFEVMPMLREMRAAGVDLEKFETFLHNRHAPERNRQVASLQGGMPDGGSGIKTADALAYMAALPTAELQLYERFAERIDAIGKGTRDYLVAEGLEKQEVVTAWEDAYKHYVPLNRVEFEAIEGNGTGMGYSVRSATSRRAMGSDKPVGNIIGNLVRQREAAITRAEKNRIGKSLFALFAKHPNPEFALPVSPKFFERDVNDIAQSLIDLGMDTADAMNIAQEEKQRLIEGNAIKWRTNPALRGHDNVLALRVNGEDHYVFFNKMDPRAMRLARSLKNLDVPALGGLMKMLGAGTRWLSMVNTQYNPVFGIFNFMRDFGGALVNLTSTRLAGAQGAIMRDALPALWGILIDLRAHREGKKPTSSWAQDFEEFQREGGQTGFRDLFASPEDRQTNIKLAMDPSSWVDTDLGRFFTAGGRLKVPFEMVRKAAVAGKLPVAFGWLSDYNEAIENSLRLAAYREAKRRGMSKQEAAVLAKNLTVNFNRKGQIATQAGALYGFFNAATQGTARLVETLQGPAGKRILTGGLLLGVMQALMLAAMGFDDEEPPEFVRDRSFLIPNLATDNDKDYIALPLPLGLHVLPATARRVTEFAGRGFKDPAGFIGGLLGLYADAFNPIGGGSDVVAAITPSVFDPAVALARNVDWTGRPIAKQDFSSLNPTPGHTRARDTATPWSEAIAEFLNWSAGGTEFKPGLFSPTPDQIDYLIGQAFGGVYREASKIAATGRSFATGEDLPVYKMPLIGRLAGNANEAAAERSRYYSTLRQINMHENEIKGRRENGQGATVAEYLRDNPDARLISVARDAERDVRALQKRKRDLVERGASPETVRLLEERIARRMKQLNDRARALREAA